MSDNSNTIPAHVQVALRYLELIGALGDRTHEQVQMRAQATAIVAQYFAIYTDEG